MSRPSRRDPASAGIRRTRWCLCGSRPLLGELEQADHVGDDLHRSVFRELQRHRHLLSRAKVGFELLEHHVIAERLQLNRFTAWEIDRVDGGHDPATADLDDFVQGRRGAEVRVDAFEDVIALGADLEVQRRVSAGRRFGDPDPFDEQVNGVSVGRRAAGQRQRGEDRSEAATARHSTSLGRSATQSDWRTPNG